MKQKILVVDDEADVVELIEYNLRNVGFDVVCATDGEEALAKIKTTLPDMIVLDIMLPGKDGFEVCKQLKRDPKTANIPIIMLTAKAAEVDRVVGLELGADDYITKPFSPRELVLRIKALFRRLTPPSIQESIIKYGKLIIDPIKHEVTVDNKEIDLTPTEFKLLHFLAANRGRVQSRDRLLQEVWGYEGMLDTRTVDTHIRRLREKLGKAGEYIETVRGFGYKFVE